jgi:hypothetical protein
LVCHSVVCQLTLVQARAAFASANIPGTRLTHRMPAPFNCPILALLYTPLSATSRRSSSPGAVPQLLGEGLDGRKQGALITAVTIQIQTTIAEAQPIENHGHGGCTDAYPGVIAGIEGISVACQTNFLAHADNDPQMVESFWDICGCLGHWGHLRESSPVLSQRLRPSSSSPNFISYQVGLQNIGCMPRQAAHAGAILPESVRAMGWRQANHPAVRTRRIFRPVRLNSAEASVSAHASAIYSNAQKREESYE